MTNVTTITRGICTLALAGILTLGPLGSAWAVSSDFTASLRSGAQSGLEGCRSKPDAELHNCVATQLNNAADRMARWSGQHYRAAQRAFRAAATSVQSATTTAVAVAAVATAKAELQRATGEVAPHYNELSQVMDTARSVLRS